jgi:DNA-binding XRE family transcriptional regulator
MQKNRNRKANALRPARVDQEPAGTFTGLELHRRDLGLSQTKAACVTGISRRQLARLEAEPVWTDAAVRVALTYCALRVLVGAPPYLTGVNGKEAT